MTQLDIEPTVVAVSIIRGSSLLNYRNLVADLGADPDPLLRDAGIKPADAGEHEAFISYRGLILALESAARVTGADDFGRQLALRQGIEILGPVGVAARTAATMGDALAICSVYLSAYSPAIAVGLEPLSAEGELFFEFRIVAASMPPAPQSIELSLGIALAVFRYLRGDDYRPQRVHLPHSPITPEATYRTAYGCPPSFGQRRAGFTMRAADLARGVSDDSQAHEVIVRYLQGLLPQAPDDLREPTRILIEQLLPTGAVSMDLIARQLALHPKAFQRRLTAEGTTFGQLVSTSRQRLLEHYLRDTDLPLTQVARELGYAEQSVLTRSCSRWFGVGPAQLRTELRI